MISMFMEEGISVSRMVLSVKKWRIDDDVRENTEVSIV